MGRAGVIAPRPVARTAATVGTVAWLRMASTAARTGEKTGETTGTTGETTADIVASEQTLASKFIGDRDRAGQVATGQLLGEEVCFQRPPFSLTPVQRT